jgi:succinyl-CoA synthetase alpha subunit
MAILIDEKKRVLVQGITGAEGRARTRLMREYGTNVVGSGVALLNFLVTDSRFSRVFRTSFEEIQIIQQIFDFLTNLGKFSPFPSHRTVNFALEGFSHKFFFDLRLFESQ